MVCNTSTRASKYSLFILPKNYFSLLIPLGTNSGKPDQLWLVSGQHSDDRIFNPENRIWKDIYCLITGQLVINNRKTEFACMLCWSKTGFPLQDIRKTDYFWRLSKPASRLRKPASRLRKPASRIASCISRSISGLSDFNFGKPVSAFSFLHANRLAGQEIRQAGFVIP